MAFNTVCLIVIVQSYLKEIFLQRLSLSKKNLLQCPYLSLVCFEWVLSAHSGKTKEKKLHRKRKGIKYSAKEMIKNVL
jgi:hypothetical protein